MMKKISLRFVGALMAALFVFVPIVTVGVSAADEKSPLADVHMPESNIVLAPTLIADVTDEGIYGEISDTLPTVAIFEAQLEGKTLKVVVGEKTKTIDQIMDFLDNMIIPAFRVDSASEAEALGSYVKGLDNQDVYVISDELSCISAARAVCDRLYAMYDATSYSGDIEKLRASLASNGARGAILSLDYATREKVSYIQDRFLSVWVTADGSRVESVTAINTGALGIVSADTAATEACFTKYYTAGTLVRTPEVVGHRGCPSLGQECSIASSEKAFEVGATMVECDIYLMKDGNIVVMHDETLDRTTNGTGNTEDQTAESIKSFVIDVNTAASPEPIPLLDDYFKTFKESGEVIVVEIKSPQTAIAEPFAKMIKKYGVEKQVVAIAFDTNMIKALKKACPELSISWVCSSITADESQAISVADKVLDTAIPLNTTYMPSRKKGTLGTNLYTALAHRGVTVWIWTIYDNQAQFDEYFVSGVRGITTNNPQQAGECVEEIVADIKGGTLNVYANLYNGETQTVDNAKIVAVKGKVKLDSSSGKLSLDGCDEASFFVEYSTATPSGKKYTVVSEMLTLKKEAVSTENSNVSDNTEQTQASEETKKKGCGSAMPALVPFVILLPTAIAVRKKRR